MQTVQCFQNKLPMFYLFCGTKTLLYRSRNIERNLIGGTNSFASQFLHPSLVQSPRSIQHMQTVQVPKKTFFNLIPFLWDQVCFTDQETQKENLLGGTTSFVDQYLHQSYTKLKIHSISFNIRITLCQIVRS